jgi:hypothetical protein
MSPAADLGLGADAAAAAVLVLLLAGGLVGWLLVRRLRRAVRRLPGAAGAAVLLRARSDPRLAAALDWVGAHAAVHDTLRRAHLRVTPAGGPREAAALRHDLRASLASTRAALATLPADAQRGELPALARRLERLAAPLDAELRHLVREPDPSVRATLLPGARSRVQEVLGVASRLRTGIALVLAGRSSGDLGDLDADVRSEVEALRTGAEALAGQPARTP